MTGHLGTNPYLTAVAQHGPVDMLPGLLVWAVEHNKVKVATTIVDRHLDVLDDDTVDATLATSRSALAAQLHLRNPNLPADRLLRYAAATSAVTLRAAVDHPNADDQVRAVAAKTVSRRDDPALRLWLATRPETTAAQFDTLLDDTLIADLVAAGDTKDVGVELLLKVTANRYRWHRHIARLLAVQQARFRTHAEGSSAQQRLVAIATRISTGAWGLANDPQATAADHTRLLVDVADVARTEPMVGGDGAGTLTAVLARHDADAHATATEALWAALAAPVTGSQRQGEGSKKADWLIQALGPDIDLDRLLSLATLQQSPGAVAAVTARRATTDPTAIPAYLAARFDIDALAGRALGGLRLRDQPADAVDRAVAFLIATAHLDVALPRLYAGVDAIRQVADRLPADVARRPHIARWLDSHGLSAHGPLGQVAATLDGLGLESDFTAAVASSLLKAVDGDLDRLVDLEAFARTCPASSAAQAVMLFDAVAPTSAS